MRRHGWFLLLSRDGGVSSVHVHVAERLICGAGLRHGCRGQRGESDGEDSSDRKRVTGTSRGGEARRTTCAR